MKPIALSEAMKSRLCSFSEEEETSIANLTNKINGSIGEVFDGSPIQMIFDPNLCASKLIYEAIGRYRARGWTVVITPVLGTNQFALDPGQSKIIALSVVLSRW